MFRIIVALLITFIPQIEAKYPLAVCAIFQDEAPFLKEWIEFHKLQGAQHFYLYNNNSKDNFNQVLSPYVLSNEVTLIDWPYTYLPDDSEKWLSIQRGAYDHCIKTFGHKTSWLAVIDTDEFLFCPSGELLTSFLKNYTQYGGVCAHWLLFGTSHVQNIPEGSLMIELLTKCSPPNLYRNARVKSIVQPRYVLDCLSAHTFSYRNKFAVNANGQKITKSVNSHPILHDKIRINHYWTRTEEHFSEKKLKSRQKRREIDNEKKLRSWANSYNRSEDTAILQFVPALREKMELK